MIWGPAGVMACGGGVMALCGGCDPRVRGDLATMTLSRHRRKILGVRMHLASPQMLWINTFFEQIVGIPMGTNCASILADIFLYSYEAEFIQSLLSPGKKKLASQFKRERNRSDSIL